MGYLHNLYVGCADTTVIRTQGKTFLVDCHNIDEHDRLLPKSKTISGVFITHQHHDHFSGLGYLKRHDYDIEYLIYSPYKRRVGDRSVEFDEWNEFAGYVEYFKKRGTKLYRPFRQASWKKPWWQPAGLRVWMLGPPTIVATSDTRELHDACLVFRMDLGIRKCTFTGDASDTCLEFIARKTNHICGDILHASHHASINGAFEGFIKKCNPQYTVISTEPGVYSNIPHPDALELYEKHTRRNVYRLDETGSLVWKF